jgi:hypothetical protein
MARKKLKVTGLELETKDGKKVALTLDEARELHEQLDDLFGKEVQYVPSQPIYVRPWWERPDVPPYITCTVGPSTSNVSGIAKSNTTGMQVSYLSGPNTAGSFTD